MAPTPEHLAVIPHDFWYVYPEHAEDVVEVTCLLPNGIGISFSVSQQATMYEIKEVSAIVHTRSPCLYICIYVPSHPRRIEWQCLHFTANVWVRNATRFLYIQVCLDII